MVQRSIFSLAQASPRELYRSTLSVPEIQHRALAYVPDELLVQLPEHSSTYSLFQGFQATLPPEDSKASKKKHGRHSSRGRKLLSDTEREPSGPPALVELKNQKMSLSHRLEMLSIRKNMCSSEIREIDTKISNLNTMRKIVLERLADLEQEELDLEQEILGVDNRLEDLQEELEDEAALAANKTPQTPTTNAEGDTPPPTSDFMSKSIYEKITSPRTQRRRRVTRRISQPVLHEHLEPGSRIKELQAHNDMITALDFDYPFGTMVTAALDDTVRVWDLNAGRCMGMLEGHLSSVRCLQVEDNIVATGAMDASIRLWDLAKAEYAPQDQKSSNLINKDSGEGDAAADAFSDDGMAFANEGDELPPPPPTSMRDCPLFALEAHVAEVTALHFRGDTLVSGSADKTLRQWDLEKGRCVQTLDVLWAAAQASATHGMHENRWQTSSRLPDATADFVGALQVFDAALACGTADGMVRLWDLRSGQVHRSLVGHTGPITTLMFDDVHLVTGSLDRSIRVCSSSTPASSLRVWGSGTNGVQIWDLRTGSIFDAFAYPNPITSMMFDSRHIVAAAGEDVLKVYDKADGRHWDCGAGVKADVDDPQPAIVERVRIKDGYLIEGRKDGIVGVWSC